MFSLKRTHFSVQQTAFTHPRGTRLQAPLWLGINLYPQVNYRILYHNHTQKHPSSLHAPFAQLEHIYNQQPHQHVTCISLTLHFGMGSGCATIQSLLYCLLILSTLIARCMSKYFLSATQVCFTVWRFENTSSSFRVVPWDSTLSTSKILIWKQRFWKEHLLPGCYI